MATIIPRVTAPQVEIQQGPQVRNTARVDDSGAQALAGAIGSFARPALEYAQREQERNDTTAVMAARKQLSDWEANTFNPGNPDGISKYKGKNALGADEVLLPDLDKTVGSISAGLTPRQRQQFEGVAMNFRDSVAGRLNGYMDREHSGYISAEQKAAVDNLGQDAVSAGVAGDFSRQDRVANELLSMNRARRQADGMGEELIKAEERGLVSSVRSQTIEGMATARPFEAQAYFERYADQMTPEDRAKVDRLLYPVVSDAAAQDDADAILAGAQPQAYRDPGQRGRGPSPAIAKILDEEADAAGVPREYLYALAEQESGFNPGAVNPEVLDDGDNATGLFQYRATSAKGFDRKDARASARAAAREFAQRAKTGGVEFAVAAHFAGEGGAAAVVQRGRRADNPKTARYVEEVMGRASRWRGDAPVQQVGRTAPPSEADAIARAQAIPDPRRRAAVVSKIRERFQLSDLRRQEEDRAASEGAYTAINQASNPNAPLREILGAQVYAWAERKGHLPTLENLRKNKVAGTFTQDDAVLVESLEREAVLSPQTFARRDIHALADRISTETLGDLLGKQKQANDPSKRADWASQSQRIESGLRILGLDEAGDNRNAEGEFVAKPPKKKLDERKVQRAQFAQVYREAERAFIQRNGKDPTPAEADSILRAVVRNVATDIPGKLRRAGAIEGFGAALPAADRSEIISDFRASTGRDPTEAEIVRIGARYRMQSNSAGSN